MRLFICDQNQVRSRGLMTIATERNWDVNLLDSISRIAKSEGFHEPSVLLISQELAMNRLNNIRENLLTRPSMRIVCLLNERVPSLCKRLVGQGFSGAVLWSDIEELFSCIDALKTSRYFIQPDLMEYIFNPASVTTDSGNNHEELLTEREVEILSLIYLEYSAKEIGARLALSTRTVEWHRKRMMEKTGSRNMVGLIRYGLRKNLIEVA